MTIQKKKEELHVKNVNATGIFQHLIKFQSSAGEA